MKVEILALLIILCASDIATTTASVVQSGHDQIFTSRHLEGDDDEKDGADDNEDKKVVNPKPLPKKVDPPAKKDGDGDETSEEDKEKDKEGDAEEKKEEEEKEEESDDDK
jgi:hypothetical protein